MRTPPPPFLRLSSAKVPLGAPPTPRGRPAPSTATPARPPRGSRGRTSAPPSDPDPTAPAPRRPPPPPTSAARGRHPRGRPSARRTAGPPRRPPSRRRRRRRGRPRAPRRTPRAAPRHRKPPSGESKPPSGESTPPSARSGSDPPSARLRTEPSPHPIATRPEDGSRSSAYANPPRPAARHSSASVATSRDANVRSCDAVNTDAPVGSGATAKTALSCAPRNRSKADASEGGEAESRCSRPRRLPSRSAAESTRQRRSSPPWLATSNDARRGPGPGGTEDGTDHARATHGFARCAPWSLGRWSGLGSASVARSVVFAPSQVQSVTEPPRSALPTASAAIPGGPGDCFPEALGAASSIVGSHASWCTSAALAGRRVGSSGDPGESALGAKAKRARAPDRCATATS
jgi:hypothetical protein